MYTILSKQISNSISTLTLNSVGALLSSLLVSGFDIKSVSVLFYRVLYRVGANLLWVDSREGTYSSVPNRRACTFINFEEKIPPARPYLALHVYCF